MVSRRAHCVDQHPFDTRGAMKLLHAAERETARMQRETELGAEQVKFEADISAEVTAATRKEMAEWLGRNRLHLHAEVITAVAGL